MDTFRKLTQIKTLLVDDDELVRDSLSLAFKNKGCFLQTTQTAEQGLRALGNETFDIVISDFKLPRLDGLEFFKQATAYQPDTVNVLISAYKDEVVASRAPDVGVHAFIEKPFSVKDLTKSLSLLIEKRNAINRYNSWIMIPITSYPPPPALPLFVSPVLGIGRGSGGNSNYEKRR